MYTNRYIFIYSTIMVIIVAAVLSTAAMFLKPFQEANIRIEKIQSILASADIESTKENAEELFDKHIIQELLINLDGEVTSIYEEGAFSKGDERAFDLDLKISLKLKKEGGKTESGKPPQFPLFVAEKNGSTIYILPLLGNGLWGPIWGNLSLKEDWKTVVGTTFGHKGETPGLGAEIDQKFFQVQFIGKQIFDDNGEFKSIKVQKGGALILPEDLQIHAVDAISGGTITSDGVTVMLKDCLENYVPYIKKTTIKYE